MNRVLIFLFILVLHIQVCSAEGRFPANVEASLALAGENRASLERMLLHYQQNGDKEKYDAACYLVANMRWHYTGGRVLHYDAAIDSFRYATDALYYSLICNATTEQQESDPLHKTLIDTTKALANCVQSYRFQEPEVLPEELLDVQSIDGDFVSRQIEHAFRLRRTVERVKQLPFEDFLESVLPYRAISGFPLVTAADTLHRLFGKYLRTENTANLVSVAERYNRAIYWLRRSHGGYPFETTIGFPDLFYNGIHDCIDMAEYCAQILRACGVPAMVETNVAYRIWASRHYMVVVFDEKGQPIPFNPETSVPKKNYDCYRPCLNIHRLHFASQPNNPYALAEGKESVPTELAEPTIEDVSSQYMNVAHLAIPAGADVPSSRKLAYLATFQPGTGLVAVTWGVRKKGDFEFLNVVGDNIYFPVWCDSTGTLRPMGQPFQVLSDSTCQGGYRIDELPRPLGKMVNVTLRRKYPRKPHLLEQARRTVGTVVLGCDSLNFHHADTLAMITAVPEAEWTDLPLNTTRPYRYYRVRAAATDPHLHLSEIQFLTRGSHGYSNVIAPTSIEEDATSQKATWQRLMDEPLEKCKWKAEYDGNVQTAPDAYPDVTLRLAAPQWVEHLRFVVKHADNGVRAGDNYLLRKWGTTGWENVWIKRADSNSFPNEQLEVGGLYWLSNLSRGREELPFTINADGTIAFPHEWIVEAVEQGRH